MSIGSPDSTVGIEDHPASAEPVRTAATPHGKSPSRIAFDRLRKDRVAVICASIVLFFILIAIFAPLLAKLEGQDYSTFHTDLIDEYGYPTIGINGSHWFGVEPKTGRDNFARWVFGARPSLIIAFLATVVGTVIGVVMGLLAGFLGGWVDRVISWLIDFVLSLPYLLFAIALVPIVESMRGGSFNLTPQEQASIRFYVLIFASRSSAGQAWPGSSGARCFRCASVSSCSPPRRSAYRPGRSCSRNCCPTWSPRSSSRPRWRCPPT